MMSDRVVDFIRIRRIDSFQKLRLLLFLFQHPDLSGTSQQFAKHLFLGDTRLLEQMIRDLQEVGLVECVDNHCRLYNQPEVRSCLQCLARAFEDPLARQKMLDQVRNGSFFNHYQEDVNETN
jgi:hypothetical protein